MGASGTVTAALRILDLFTPERGRWTVREIGAALGTSHATTYRYVNSLRAARLVEVEDGVVTLSPRLLYLGHVVQNTDYLVQSARPSLVRLAAETGETSIASRLMGTAVVGIDRVESHRLVRYSFSPGQQMPVNAGAAAKAILAFLEPMAVQRLLASCQWIPFTEATVTDPEAFRAELAVVRVRGWAQSDGEVEPDIAAIAVPIRFPWGEVAGSLTVCGPRFRMTDMTRHEWLDLLTREAQQVERLLGDRVGSEKGGHVWAGVSAQG